MYASAARYESDADVQQYSNQMLDAVRAVPGVAAAGVTGQLPLSGDYMKYGVRFESMPQIDSTLDSSALRYAVTPDYFAALQIPLRSGRLLNDRDVAGAPGAVVINESFARRMFADRDPIGERVSIGADDQPWAYIVGVVADVKHQSLDAPDENAVYISAAQDYIADRALWLVVRTRTNATALAPAIRNAIWSVDADQPISDVATMDERLARSAAERRFILLIFETFALTALLLAAVGLYGLLAGGVQERLREIGVRSALGATSGEIVGLIMRQAMMLTAFGATIGFLGALGAARALTSLLFGTATTDAGTWIGAALLLVFASTVAASLPAWRAMRVDPAITLRAP
jgi:predicted permease